MKRRVAFGCVAVLAAAMATGLSGCATTGVAASGTQGSAGELQAAGPTPQDPNPHGVAMARGDGAFSNGASHDGIPTPEPAAPAERVERETRFAGPTPQIPIPVHGGGRPSIERY